MDSSDFLPSMKMPRTKKQVNQSQPVETQQQSPPVETTEAKPSTPTKEDYRRARQTIKQYRETKKSKPKRQCSEKQLAALAAGRARNKRFASSKSTD